MSLKIKETLSDCIHCGLCLSSCPTYRTSGLEVESPRGRLMIMDYLITNFKLEEPIDNSMFNHLSTCLDCRNCETVCPSDVNYHVALENTWELFSYKGKKKSLVSRYLLFLIKMPILLKIIFKLIRIIKFFNIDNNSTLIKNNLVKNIKFIPTHSSKLKPGFYNGFGSIKGTIGLFTGCIMSEMYPKVHIATLNVIRKLGFNVVISDFDLCCGALHRHDGYLKTAEKLINKSYPYLEAFDIVVVNSAGCGAELKNKVKDLNTIIMDFSEFVDKYDFKVKKKLDKTAIWDSPCHLIHGQKITNQPIRLLEKIGLKLVESNHINLCCGAAGNYMNNHSSYSEKILNIKMNQIKNLNINYLITSNPGCHFQLHKGVKERGISIKVIHIAEILDMAMS